MSDSHRSITPSVDSEGSTQPPLGSFLLEIFKIRPLHSFERFKAKRRWRFILVALVATYVFASLCLTYQAMLPPIVLDVILLFQALVTGWALVSGVKTVCRLSKSRETFFREMAQDVAETIPQSYQMVLRLKLYPLEELLVARREYDRALTGVAERTSALKLSDLPQVALLIFGYFAAQLMGWVQTIHVAAWRNSVFAGMIGVGIVYSSTFLIDLNSKLTKHSFLRIVDLLDEAIAAKKRDEELAKDAAKKTT